ncbi:SDR family NAD(P)-dependent oxidoreductase [Brachyspira intermedia]|uniref:SDR family NAD(P)-dependent oxidoreductase n=1 Tax=Brachyspira intermedia TaxID=84377 RepID=UPI0030078D8F
MFKKYIVITGASSGLGYEFAKSFAEINKNLILIARRKELLENLKQEINELNPNINVIIKIADLSNTENVYNIYNELKIYNIETWINNAGMGDYGYDIYDKNNIYKINKIEKMLKLNIEALTIFSMLFIQDYKDVENTQLINISSAGGYNIVFARVPYSSTKFYVNAFTEGLSEELKTIGSKLKVKLLAPSALTTEFTKKALDDLNFEFPNNVIAHNAKQVSNFLLQLYYSDSVLGLVNRNTLQFKIQKPIFKYVHNDRIRILYFNIIKKIAWWIPVRKWRNNFRKKFYIL